MTMDQREKTQRYFELRYRNLLPDNWPELECCGFDRVAAAAGRLPRFDDVDLEAPLPRDYRKPAKPGGVPAEVSRADRRRWHHEAADAQHHRTPR